MQISLQLRANAMPEDAIEIPYFRWSTITRNGHQKRKKKIIALVITLSVRNFTAGASSPLSFAYYTYIHMYVHIQWLWFLFDYQNTETPSPMLFVCIPCSIGVNLGVLRFNLLAVIVAHSAQQQPQAHSHTTNDPSTAGTSEAEVITSGPFDLFNI